MFDSQDNPSVAIRNANLSFVLFIVGSVVGVLNLSMTVPFGAGFEMVALAHNLASHGAYANPFYVLDTGPSAANPPLYPLLLALFMKVLSAPFVPLAATLGNIFANALTAAWLPRISILFYRDSRPGIAASVFWILAVQLMPSWDVSYTVAALILFCLLTASTIKKNKLIPAIAAGLLVSALFLLNPSSMLIVMTWVAYLCVFRRASVKQTILYFAVVIMMLAVVIFSWSLRNYEQLGHFIVRSNLGMTLYASNNDCASPSLNEEEHTGCYLSHHPNMSLHEAQTLHTLGEVEYDRRRTADAKEWMRSHPEKFVHLTAARLRDFWFPAQANHPLKSVLIWVATIFSVPGLIWMAYRRERITLFILASLLIYPLMYYIVVSDVRYRYPVLWLSLLPAGYFIDSVVQLRYGAKNSAVGRELTQAPSSSRMASAIASACLRIASSLSASIITRARVSVPE